MIKCEKDVYPLAAKRRCCMTYKLLYKDTSENADEHIRDIVSRMRVSHVCWLCYRNEQAGKQLYARFIRNSQSKQLQLVDLETGEELAFYRDLYLVVHKHARPDEVLSLRFYGYI